MSIFDELLITIDDLSDARLDQIENMFPQYSRQTISAALGRLMRWRWLENRSGSQTAYSVTSMGNNYLDQALDSIRQSDETWPESWFCVAVNIPSDDRQLRDRLRHYFIVQGYGRLIDSLWISARDRQAEMALIVREFNLGAKVYIFVTEPLGPATNQIIIANAWDWSRVKQSWQKYLIEAPARVSGIEALAGQEMKNPEGRLRLRLAAKNFVFEYGQLRQSGPNLPLDFSLSRDLDVQARALYERIRPLCYR